MAEKLGVLKTVYSVADFLDWQRAGTLDLRPYFQRNDVWSKSAKSYFVDTLVRGFPVPLLLLQSGTHPDTFRAMRRVVDGQQRLRTILAYIDPSCLSDFKDRDDFVLMRTHNRDLGGRPFDELPEDARDRILATELSVHVLGSGYRREQILEVFARMNSTGKRLNAQELRNAEFHGEMKQAAYELAYEQLESWQTLKTFTADQIAEMKEVEFTSELIDYVMSGLKGKTKPNLQHLYRAYDIEFSQRDEVSRRIRNVMKRVNALLTDSEDHLKLPRFGKQGWLYVLFAIIHDSRFGAALDGSSPNVPKGYDLTALGRRLPVKHDSLGEVGLPEVVLKAMRGAATDLTSRRTRLRYLVDED